MRNGENLTNILDPNGNVVSFSDEKNKRVATATGGPGGDDNWLMNLERGTVFTCRSKGPKGQPKPWLAGLYFLKNKNEHSANIMAKVPDGKDLDLWVHILDFSRQHEYIETIAILDFDDSVQEQEEEQTE